jgi:hypothetical protein
MTKQLFLKIYVTIATIVGLVGALIAIGNLLSSQMELWMISDDEYIASNYYYEIDQCSGDKYAPGADVATPKSDEEIQACKIAARERILSQRSFYGKQSIINGIVRGLLFALLFAIHFPRLRRLQAQE